MKTGEKYYVFSTSFESIDGYQKEAAELSAAARKQAAAPPDPERGHIAMSVWRQETNRLQTEAARKYAVARDAITRVREKELQHEFFMSVYLPWRERKVLAPYEEGEGKRLWVEASYHYPF